MEIAPELAVIVHQHSRHQEQILTMMAQILHALTLLTERVADLERVLVAILAAEDDAAGEVPPLEPLTGADRLRKEGSDDSR